MGSMVSDTDSFAFIIHPVNIKRDVARKYPLLGKLLTERQINFFSQFFPPVYISEVSGVRSIDTGRELKGWLIACPLTQPAMMSLPQERVYKKIVACGHLAEKLGAKILGLGAYTSIVGDAGVTIADRLDIPVTTGDSYTVTMAVDALHEAARQMDIDMATATVAVVGATGTIGKTSAQLLAADCARLKLVGRRMDALQALHEQCVAAGGRDVSYGAEISAIYDADLILSVSSSVGAIIEPQHLKPGAVVYDVATPHDVSRRVIAERDDVLVIDGGMIAVPGPVDFNFNFGLPPKMAYACMAETMALALERRYEDYTVGRHVPFEKAREIGQIASRHGFRLGGFRSFGREISPATVAAVRERAAIARKTWSPGLP